ncbi:MAG: hypothetical protein K2H85_11515, partial [Allobaculum sp.]|nr:hypothetical protein [Allobaculum sp.]
GIDNVPLLIQLIVNGNEVDVIEFSARTGGGSKVFFLREMVGFDVIENLLDITFGEKPKIHVEASKENAIIKYVYTYPGIFSKIENLDKLHSDGYIMATYQYKPYGTKISSSNYSSDRPVGFLIKGKDKYELKKKIDYINQHISILDENGLDIMRHDFF